MSLEKLTPLNAFERLRPDFIVSPWLALGATDSAHEVFFGTDGDKTVGVKTFLGNDSRGSANKLSPFDRAEHEMDMLKSIRRLGFYTLTPIRIIETNKGNMAFLMTAYEPNLTTMSTVVQDSSEARTKSCAKRLISTSKILGELHALGVSHGDSQIKNFGIAPAHPGIMVFDLEKGGTDMLGHFKNSPFLHDLESLVQSLAHKSYGGENTEVANSIIYDQVIEPYVDVIKQKLKKTAQEIGATALITHYEKHQELHDKGLRHHRNV